ncbi:MAG: FkbM family methyltransferase [Stigonema ocellatum SAG 48.90 = DSM 106950]|nr:FkbM family methyltransferase [Stigonema ocellatum SAG 48.90 = DSM 106950]
MRKDDFINSPSPIERELKLFFSSEQKLVILDIGSCEGEDSIKYSRIFPLARIYAVEPLPNNFPILLANLEKYGVTNVKALPIALSDEVGKASFYVSSGHPEHLRNTSDWDYGNKSSSLLPPDETEKYYPWLKFNEVITVDTDTLENVCREHGITTIDFIHMDVQGAELKVLHGAGSLIKDIKAIWLEVEAVSLYKEQPLKRDIEGFMARNNFEKIKDTVNNVSGDQFYINKNYLQNFLHVSEKKKEYLIFRRQEIERQQKTLTAVAQATWVQTKTQNTSLEVEQHSEQLIGILDIEAQRQATLGNIQTSWIIRQHIRNITPTYINNLLHLIQHSIDLGIFTPDLLEEWQVVELIRQGSFSTVDTELLLQVFANTAQLNLQLDREHLEALNYIK